MPLVPQSTSPFVQYNTFQGKSSGRASGNWSQNNRQGRRSQTQKSCGGRTLGSSGGATQNQMFAINRQQADEDPNVITSTLNAFWYLARVLIDPAATHSCISPQFPRMANIQPIPLYYEFGLFIPTGEIIRINWEFKIFPILIGAELMEANLVTLQVVEFDLIWGMNCLLRNHVHIDYFRKLAIFHPLGGPLVEFQGERRILPNTHISCLDECSCGFHGFDEYGFLTLFWHVCDCLHWWYLGLF